ncbi:MAG: hypothetical protein ACK574_04830 [Bacteroidota bacterium]|jgi:hypothetical protein
MDAQIIGVDAYVYNQQQRYIEQKLIEEFNGFEEWWEKAKVISKAVQLDCCKQFINQLQTDLERSKKI